MNFNLLILKKMGGKNVGKYFVDIKIGDSDIDWCFLLSDKELKVNRYKDAFCFSSKRDLIRKLKKLGKLIKLSNDLYREKYNFTPNPDQRFMVQ